MSRRFEAKSAKYSNFCIILVPATSVAFHTAVYCSISHCAAVCCATTTMVDDNRRGPLIQDVTLDTSHRHHWSVDLVAPCRRFCRAWALSKWIKRWSTRIPGPPTPDVTGALSTLSNLPAARQPVRLSMWREHVQ